MLSRLLQRKKTSGWTRAESLRSGDRIVAGTDGVLVVRQVLREGDEVVVLGKPGVVRRFDPMDQVHVASGKPGYAFIEVPDQFPTPVSEALAAVREQIDVSDLMGKGLEEHPHVTVRFGLLGDAAAVVEYLRTLAPFEITFGDTTIFDPSKSSDGASVIVVAVDSPELMLINTALAERGEWDAPTFDYKPHMTVAYVEPESAKKYADMPWTAGATLKVEEITVRDSQSSTVVKLEGNVAKVAAGLVVSNAAELDALPLGTVVRYQPSNPAFATTLYTRETDGWLARLKPGAALLLEGYRKPGSAKWESIRKNQEHRMVASESAHKYADMPGPEGATLKVDETIVGEPGSRTVVKLEGNAEKMVTASSAFPSFEQFMAEHGHEVLNMSDNHDYFREEAESEVPGFSDLDEDEQDRAMEKLATDRFEEQFYDLVHHYEQMPFPATVYRIVSLLGGIESLRTENIGESWTWDEASAIEFLPGNQGRFLLKAEVDADAVDWDQTLILNLDTALGTSENEMRIKFDAPLKLVAYRRKQDKQWTPFTKMITASDPIAPNERLIKAAARHAQMFQTASSEDIFEKWIGIDLDGTLSATVPGNDYSDPTLIGPPIARMVTKVRHLLDAGYTVKIFTARMADEENAERIRAAIADWTEEHIGTALDATNQKTPGTIEIWDNIARRVDTGTGKAASFTPDEKINGPVPDIKYLPLTAIERHQDWIETGYETGTVSDEVAANMDFSEPVDVTAYRYGRDPEDDAEPVVMLEDGHHRYAAALQTGRSWLPVAVQARNAKGYKLNALIALSKQIEASGVVSKTASDIEAEYPRAGAIVGGLRVGPDVPNTESIASSFNDYRVLKGIRVVSLEGWSALPKDCFYSADDIRRCHTLAEKIKASGWIAPLIVGVGDGEPYIVEGLHRLGALGLLGAKEFPAMVVIDEEEVKPASKTASANIPDFDTFVKKNGGLVRMMKTHDDKWGYFREMASYGNMDWKDMDADERKVEILAAAENWYSGKYEEATELFGNFSYPLEIYRCVKADGIANVNTHELGLYWSWNEEHAKAYGNYGGRAEEIILKGRVEADGINWNRTLMAALCSELDEQEITVLKGAAVELVGWKSMRGRDKQWQSPPAQVAKSASIPAPAGLPVGTLVAVTVGGGFTARRMTIASAADGWHAIDNFAIRPARVTDMTGEFHDEPIDVSQFDITYSQVIVKGIRPGDTVENIFQLACLPEGAILHASTPSQERDIVKRGGKFINDGKPVEYFHFEFKTWTYVWVDAGKTASKVYVHGEEVEHDSEEVLAANMRWVQRHKYSLDAQDRVRLFHATPQQTAAKIEATGLAYGSHLIGDSASALHFAGRDRELTPADLVLFEAWLPLDGFIGGQWAVTTRPLSPGEVSLKRVGEEKTAKVAAPRSEWFHGSSIKNLKSILSQGLLPNVKTKNWNPDRSSGSSVQVSLESYGGTYVTRNLLTALGAPEDRRTEGRSVMVCLEMQPNTMFLDEDSITGVLDQPIQHMSDSQWHVGLFYIAATRSDADARWQPDVAMFQKTYSDTAIERWKYEFKEKYKTEMHPDLEAEMRKELPACWIAAMGRRAAHLYKTERADYEAKRAYAQVAHEKAKDMEWADLPSAAELFPTPAQGEEDFRNAVEKITRSLRIMARPSTGNDSMYNRDSARVMEPIGYSGSNKITAVLEVRDGPAYVGEDWKKPVPIIVHYGSVPAMFVDQWKARQGSELDIQQRPEAKAASATPDLPAEPGTAPIPAHTLRLWHYTNSGDAAEAIRMQGLLKSKARGDDNTGTGPSAGVWAATQPPSFYGKIVIEFYAPLDQISRNADYPRSGQSLEDFQAEMNHVVMTGDVPARQIIAIHEPWHSLARTLIRDNAKETMPYLFTDEEIASFKDYPREGPALAWYRDKYMGGKAPKTASASDEDEQIPTKLYHATTQRLRKSILSKGLLAKEPKGAGRGAPYGVYGLADPNDFREDGPWDATRWNDIWEFDTRGLVIKPDEAIDDSWYSDMDVPPAQVRLYRAGEPYPKKAATNLDVVPILYHGTCSDSAEALCTEGWSPSTGRSGGNAGQRRYLYLSTGIEDARWFANEKGCDSVLAVKNVPHSSLIVDPDDGASENLDEELSQAYNLPGKVALTRSLGPEHFRLLNTKTAATQKQAESRILVIVHPGSCCGSADFNIGSDASEYRRVLVNFVQRWNGAVIVMRGELDDELSYGRYAALGGAITQALSRAKASGHLSLSVSAHDPAQVTKMQGILKKAAAYGITPETRFILTGAWVYSDTTGCVGSVNEVLMNAGYATEISHTAFTDYGSNGDDDYEAEGETKTASSQIGPVYHGTKAEFDRFSEDKQSGASMFVKGFYFTDSQPYATFFAEKQRGAENEPGKVLAYQITLNHPWNGNLTTYHKLEKQICQSAGIDIKAYGGHEKAQDAVKQWLIAEGHDGLILRWVPSKGLPASLPKEVGPINEYIVFDADQIRPLNGAKTASAFTLPILRTLTRDQAVAIRSKLNDEGKNKGYPNSGVYDEHLMPPGDYYELSMPLSLIDYIHQSTEREKDYAEREGELPPIMATYSPRAARRGRRQVQASDGNHRCCAAELRGDTEIRALIQADAYDRFLAVMNGDAPDIDGEQIAQDKADTKTASKQTPSGEYPKFLNNGDAIAEYISSMATSYVDEDFMKEFFAGSHAVLQQVPLASIREGHPDLNVPDSRKEESYKKKTLTTMPPIVVTDGVIVDGHHRYRVARDAGALNIWCYVVEDGELKTSTPQPVNGKTAQLEEGETAQSEILVIVHPGSCCGSADFNIGSVASEYRRVLTDFLNDWNGSVIVLKGELDDELAQARFSALNTAINQVLSRAQAAGLLSLSVTAYDPAQVTKMRAILKKAQTYGITPDTRFTLTGAWAYSDTRGCVGSVNKVLREAGYKTNISYTAFHQAATKKVSMNITVPPAEAEHFWQEPAENMEEFWAFRWPVKAQVGDRVVFNLNKKPIAEAVISRIEKPGEHECETTGRFLNRWKVYWTPESFKKIETKTAALQRSVMPLFMGITYMSP
jgi:hypothetical protein